MAAFIVDHDLQKPNLKHFCKICKKGFGCGRALGGHMRAHGIADDSTSPHAIDDDDHVSTDWDDTHHNKSNLGPTNRRMYALRTNPNRLKTCRVCENCGKEFFSWKSFLEHGKCTTTSDDLDSLLSSPPCSDDDDDDDDDDDECSGAVRRGSGNHSNNNWLKRKRSLRVKVGSPASNEDEDLANCLIMLSNGAVEPMFEEDEAEVEVEVEVEAEAEAEESCASASKEDHHLILHHNNNHNNIRKPINFIPPLSYRLPDQDKTKAAAPKGMFECKACKKVFNSHQALGGHRASHKKVKGCFAARLDHMELDPRENDDVFEDSFFPTKPNNNSYELGSSTMASSSKRKTKVHECSICHRIFSSGQALGGHKRCHWITSNAAAEAPPPPSIAKIHQFHDHRVPPPPFDSNSTVVLPLDLKLDLNLPALADEVRRPAFEVSTEIYLQSWICKNNKVDENDPREQRRRRQQHQQHQNDNENKVVVKNEEENNCTKNNSIIHNNNNNNNNNNNVEDEADSKVKLAKLSELNDTSMVGGNSSPWLQVGLGSTTPDP
ncbi:Zinc finger protein ZAT2, partial [Cucurbita argyrosperma subsp. argyrosperma]